MLKSTTRTNFQIRKVPGTDKIFTLTNSSTLITSLSVKLVSFSWSRVNAWHFCNDSTSSWGRSSNSDNSSLSNVSTRALINSRTADVEISSVLIISVSTAVENQSTFDLLIQYDLGDLCEGLFGDTQRNVRKIVSRRNDFDLIEHVVQVLRYQRLNGRNNFVGNRTAKLR